MAIVTLRRNLLALAGGGLIDGTLSGRADAQAGARIDFEDAAVGSLPPDFTPALTGGGGPVKWSIVDDATAPAGRKVLAQTSSDRTDDRFPLAILRQPFRADIEARERRAACRLGSYGGAPSAITANRNFRDCPGPEHFAAVRDETPKNQRRPGAEDVPFRDKPSFQLIGRGHGGAIYSITSSVLFSQSLKDH
jgi:hypothetical protein